MDRILNPVIGQQIDVRDTGSIWCRATILEVIKPNHESFVKIEQKIEEMDTGEDSCVKVGLKLPNWGVEHLKYKK